MRLHARIRVRVLLRSGIVLINQSWRCCACRATPVTLTSTVPVLKVLGWPGEHSQSIQIVFWLFAAPPAEDASLGASCWFTISPVSQAGSLAAYPARYGLPSPGQSQCWSTTPGSPSDTRPSPTWRTCSACPRTTRAQNGWRGTRGAITGAIFQTSSIFPMRLLTNCWRA